MKQTTPRKVKEKKPVLFILLFAGSILFIFLILQPLEIRYAGDVALLFPRGEIAVKQRDLLLIIQVIMLLVVIPVYLLTFIFSWKYRAHNPQGNYDPDFDDHPLAEVIWWGVPLILTLIIGVLTWLETYRLDPFRPIESDRKTMTIQVVALQWKWLFIYPEERIATVNFVQFPEKTPIYFEITADAPMNSFWIPALGGQIYAMPKMRTKLHLIANETGDFRGSSANISGEGFSSMHFIAKASSDQDYQEWVRTAKESPNSLTFASYEELAVPKANAPVTVYQLKDDNLFEDILMKFMHPHEMKST